MFLRSVPTISVHKSKWCQCHSYLTSLHYLHCYYWSY